MLSSVIGHNIVSSCCGCGKRLQLAPARNGRGRQPQRFHTGWAGLSCERGGHCSALAKADGAAALKAADADGYLPDTAFAGKVIVHNRSACIIWVCLQCHIQLRFGVQHGHFCCSSSTLCSVFSCLVLLAKRAPRHRQCYLVPRPCKMSACMQCCMLTPISTVHLNTVQSCLILLPCCKQSYCLKGHM